MRAFALLLCLLGCRDKMELRPTSLEVEIEAPRVGERGQRTVVEVDLRIKNGTSEPQEMFVFVTAHNHEPKPPTRLVWPPSAEPELRNVYAGFVVGVPTRGHRVQLAAGATTSTTCVLVSDPTRRALQELWIQGFDASGQLVYDRRDALR